MKNTFGVVAACGLIAFPVLSVLGQDNKAESANQYVKIETFQECQPVSRGDRRLFAYYKFRVTSDKPLVWLQRWNYHTAEHPELMRSRLGRAGYYRWASPAAAHVYHGKYESGPTINHARAIPCWKPIDFSHCAYFLPDDLNPREFEKTLATSPRGIREEMKAYNEKLMAFLVDLPCYREIVNDRLLTRAGSRYQPLTGFVSTIRFKEGPNRGRWELDGDRIYSSTAKPGDPDHISKVPGRGDND